ncbi:MAG: hypothetical protein JXP34_16955, partial [Planctomycetes bacterium]|nr:hypothetical protein [Planctomycetota bacterium]
MIRPAKVWLDIGPGMLALWLAGSRVLGGAPDPLSIVYDVRHADLVVSADTPFQGLGLEVFVLGDVNGDGYDDLAFFGGRDPVLHAFVLYGRPGIPSVVNLADHALWGTRIDSPSGEIWPVPSPAGDVNGDGFDDIAFRH